MKKDKSFFGYVGSGLPKQIIKGWWEAQEQYSLKVDEAPWAFNERASISMLAAGCWLAGGVALEEFSTDKKNIDRKIKSMRVGRGDLFLKLDHKEFACEAKYDYLILNSNEDVSLEDFSSLKRNYLEAANDASLLGPGMGVHTALLFISVSHTGMKLDKTGVECVDTLVKKMKAIRKQIGATGIAWYFRRDWMGKPTVKGGSLWEMGNFLFVGKSRRKQ